jgi:hypothetical protein
LGKKNTPKINAYGCNIAFSEAIICETEKNATLSHARVADEHEFEEVIIVPHHF